jgi:predicted regulator of Ras-like GTPase activity (Roadblock/LC7/MglB family)
VEHDRGLAIVSAVSADAVLLVLVSAGANVGQLMYDVRRHREQIAALV